MPPPTNSKVPVMTKAWEVVGVMGAKPPLIDIHAVGAAVPPIEALPAGGDAVLRTVQSEVPRGVEPH